MKDKIVEWSLRYFHSIMILIVFGYGFELMSLIAERSYPFAMIGCVVVAVTMVLLIWSLVLMNLIMREVDKMTFNEYIKRMDKEE